MDLLNVESSAGADRGGFDPALSAPGAVAAVGFVHLHVHSSFSLREGALTISKLAKLAAADAMPALAITDTNNLFGALEFSEKLAKEGIQPIIGVAAHASISAMAASSRRAAAEAEAGARRGSCCWRRTRRAIATSCIWPRAPGSIRSRATHRMSRLPGSTGGAGGLIALTGGPNGPLDRCFALARPEVAARRLEVLQSCFAGRLYVELQRHGLAQERAIEPHLLDLAYRALSAAGRDQRALFRQRHGLRGA